jgi:hypothetical protein
MVWDGTAVRCMTRDERTAYEQRLSQEAEALIVPFARSMQAGAPAEAVLRNLIAKSCKQPIDNPYYWDSARHLYAMVLKGSRPEAFASKWPADFGVAFKQGCY